MPVTYQHVMSMVDAFLVYCHARTVELWALSPISSAVLIFTVNAAGVSSTNEGTVPA